MLCSYVSGVVVGTAVVKISIAAPSSTIERLRSGTAPGTNASKVVVRLQSAPTVESAVAVQGTVAVGEWYVNHGCGVGAARRPRVEAVGDAQ